MISQNAFKKAAEILGCEIAAIKAVAEVESSGSGFNSDGNVKVLFEPHIFYRELESRGIKPIISDICYKKWGSKPYGSSLSQHNRLNRARSIHDEAALMSASYGCFQIMGFNYKKCGCISVYEFLSRMSESEDEQLYLFARFIINSKLDNEMREKKWIAFALAYNGVGYAKNKYDAKLISAYKKYSQK